MDKDVELKDRDIVLDTFDSPDFWVRFTMKPGGAFVDGNLDIDKDKTIYVTPED